MLNIIIVWQPSTNRSWPASTPTQTTNPGHISLGGKIFSDGSHHHLQVPWEGNDSVTKHLLYRQRETLRTTDGHHTTRATVKKPAWTRTSTGQCPNSAYIRRHSLSKQDLSHDVSTACRKTMSAIKRVLPLFQWWEMPSQPLLADTATSTWNAGDPTRIKNQVILHVYYIYTWHAPSCVTMHEHCFPLMASHPYYN